MNFKNNAKKKSHTFIHANFGKNVERARNQAFEQFSGDKYDASELTHCSSTFISVYEFHKYSRHLQCTKLSKKAACLNTHTHASKNKKKMHIFHSGETSLTELKRKKFFSVYQFRSCTIQMLFIHPRLEIAQKNAMCFHVHNDRRRFESLLFGFYFTLHIFQLVCLFIDFISSTLCAALLWAACLRPFIYSIRYV